MSALLASTPPRETWLRIFKDSTEDTVAPVEKKQLYTQTLRPSVAPPIISLASEEEALWCWWLTPPL